VIKLGRTDYWFDGRAFLFGNREKNRLITDEDRRPLLAYLCACADRLPRWQGEENDMAEVFTVGMHSRLVAALAGRLALVRGLDATAVRVAIRLGAVHDLGETLGLGDIAAPWLRSSAGADLREWCMLHQAHVEALAGLGTTPLSAHLIKDADHLAAALERRYHFGDLSHDMEHADADALIEEAGLRLDAMFPLVEHTDEWDGELVELVMGTNTGDVLVCGEPVIERGEVCRPRPPRARS